MPDSNLYSIRTQMANLQVPTKMLLHFYSLNIAYVIKNKMSLWQICNVLWNSFKRYVL